MKKATILFSIFLLTLMLTACSGTEKTRTFEYDEGISSSITYTYKGDKITYYTEQGVVPYAIMNWESKEEAKAFFDPIVEPFDNIDGVTHKIEYTETEAIEKITINYEEVVMDDIKHLLEVDSNKEDFKYLSMKNTAKLILDEGYKEVE